ncbi:DNA-binding transcriptional regulator [Phreatobacter stygius]|uniref:DNA-binding transcriptional regulator n=1 Tax=Phreatobacter stygius TaxID=1940610 RepID=UPI00147710A3|nr:DNA-binding transcriptional regulator [Phreatobacter stygius]
MSSFPPVQSVVRAFNLLVEVNRAGLTTVGDLHRRTRLPKPTIVRLLETLVAAGYVYRDERLRGYQVTSQVAELSSGFHGAPMVIEAARPWAAALTQQIKWPTAVCVLDHDAVVVRFSTIPDSPISPFHATIGYRLSLGARALGRAYLAFCPDAERRILIDLMKVSPDPENHLLSEDELERLIATARRKGFAERDLEVEPRSSATVAVPLMLGERVLGTFGITYFRSAVATPEARARLVFPLKEAAAAIEAELREKSAPFRQEK